MAATSPLAMSRRVASPDALTPSYVPPWRISVTISSDVLPTFVLTLQPVSSWKAVTQSYSGTFWPLSA